MTAHSKLLDFRSGSCNGYLVCHGSSMFYSLIKPVWPTNTQVTTSINSLSPSPAGRHNGLLHQCCCLEMFPSSANDINCCKKYAEHAANGWWPTSTIQSTAWTIQPWTLHQIHPIPICLRGLFMTFWLNFELFAIATPNQRLASFCSLSSYNALWKYPTELEPKGPTSVRKSLVHSFP